MYIVEHFLSAEALLLQAQCPRKRRAIIRHLTGNMTASGLRSWMSSLRRVGYKVPDSKVMGRGRAEIMDAIIRLESPAGEHSPAQGGEAASAQLAPGVLLPRPNVKSLKVSGSSHAGSAPEEPDGVCEDGP